MYIGHGYLCVCLSVCLPVCPSPHSHTTARTRYPLVVHYCADLQSVHEFRCYDNIHVHVCKLIALYTTNAYIAEREMSASACTRSMAGYQMCCKSLYIVQCEKAKNAMAVIY